jgi:intracellular multiplication protein IcmC
MDFSGGAFSNWANQNAEVLDNIAKNLVQVQNLLKASAYLLGLAFAFKAIYSLKAYGESRTMMSSNNSIKEPLTYLFVW